MATFSNFAKHTFSTMATADSDKSANAEYIKAKFRLTSAADYDRLLRLISPPSPPQSPSNNTASSAKSSFELTRIYTEQDYIFDGKAHDLWHAGLTLAIRHSVERYPLQGPQSVCTVALKETSFKDLIGLDGHLLAMDQLDGAPFYEVKERSEVVDYGPLQGLVNLGETLTAENCGQSQILCSTISKYYVQGTFCVYRITYQSL
jgi:hypothetical protein